MPPKRKATDDPWAPTSKCAHASTSNHRAYVGSAGSHIAADSQPKAKKARKAKDPAAPAPEKRGAMFKKACPKNIIERVERVMAQRYVFASGLEGRRG